MILGQQTNTKDKQIISFKLDMHRYVGIRYSLFSHRILIPVK